MKIYRLVLALMVVISCSAVLAADNRTEIWVHNLQGDDAHPGTRERPLATVDAAIKRLEPGTTLHVMPTEKPYPGDIRIEVSGTPEARILIDGHGSLISGRRRLPADAWKDEGDGIHSRPLPNNAWGMSSHWEGGFPLVWFDGEPGRNVTSREELEPRSYFLYKNRREMRTDPLHNTLFIRLPEGKAFDEIDVESIAGRQGIYVAGSYVTVRNFVCEYGGTDGFATHRNKGAVFENIEARYFMDQGISHHGSEVVVRNAHFHHNAGCGIVDVYPEAKIRYENCLIEENTWRGGVELHKGQFEMENCIIRANPGKALTVVKGAQAVLRNCLLVGPADEKTLGIRLDGDAMLEMANCTLYGFGRAMVAAFTAEGRLTMRRCALLRNDRNFRFVGRQNAGEPEVNLTDCITATGNVYEPARFEVMFRVKESKEARWQNDIRGFDADQYAEFAKLVGTNPDAQVARIPEADDPLDLPVIRNANGEEVGADLETPLKVGPR